MDILIYSNGKNNNNNGHNQFSWRTANKTERNSLARLNCINICNPVKHKQEGLVKLNVCNKIDIVGGGQKWAIFIGCHKGVNANELTKKN